MSTEVVQRYAATEAKPMKIRIIIPGSPTRKELTLDFSKTDPEFEVRPGSVWQDMSGKIKPVAGLELRRWVVRKPGNEKWRGAASEVGPLLRDGDVVIFMVAPKKETQETKEGEQHA